MKKPSKKKSVKASSKKGKSKKAKPKKQPAAKKKPTTTSKKSESLPTPTSSGPFLSLLADEEDASPLAQAQDLMYDAWDAPTNREALRLARKALKISPDCADAYTFLAQRSQCTNAKRLELYRQAVQTGARTLGEEVFEEDAGHFWGLFETRPYMRARHALAMELWYASEDDEAIEHFEDMLQLNPGDNQGIRYLLVLWYLETSRNDDASRLLDKYEGDIAASWPYSRALLTFRLNGDTSESRQVLGIALGSNPHVPEYLLGIRKLPKMLPAYVGIGDENEAVAYVADALAGWVRTKDALRWLRAYM